MNRVVTVVMPESEPTDGFNITELEGEDSAVRVQQPFACMKYLSE